MRRRNPLWLAPGGACLPALLASQSREGFLAALAGAVFLIVQGRPRAQQALIIGAAAVLAAFAGHLTTLVSLGAGSRSAADLANDNLVRVQVAWFAVRTALGHPLFGVGLGQFPAYAAASNGLGVYIATTNEYLQLASETGLISLAALVVLLWLALRNRARRRNGCRACGAGGPRRGHALHRLIREFPRGAAVLGMPRDSPQKRKGDQQMANSQAEISAGTRFAFGANWKSFLKVVDETRVDAARRSLAEALGGRDLSGRRLLDIGCGSGLFSLAAQQLGARVRSFDFDPDSVAATAELRLRYAPDSDWMIEQGSILDEQYVAALGAVRHRLLVGRAASHRRSVARC